MRISCALLINHKHFVTSAVPVNPFKNPFQSTPQNFPQQQQSYQNWIIPESQSPFNGFGSPLNTNGFSHGFYYNNNMANGIISQPSAFGAKGGFGNPFAVSCAIRKYINVNLISFSFPSHPFRQMARQVPTTRFYETSK